MLSGMLLAACTSAPARSALQSDLPALKAAIARAERQNQLGSSGAKELAGAVLERELATLDATDDAFPDVARCARRIRPALDGVARGSSEHAAPAALALIDAGFSVRRTGSDDGAAQAIQARQAVGAYAGSRRRAFLLHGDASVRRAALEAALATADRADVAALAEAARLDPDPEARALAIRALGRIGGERAVLALVDVSASAALVERREVALAWSDPPSFDAGGRARLEDLAQGSGEAALFGAIVLLERAPDSALASAALVRAIEAAPLQTRLLAIEAAPWSDSAARAAIGAARKHQDPATRVLALWRFAIAGALDAEGIHELEQLGTDSVTPVGAVARAALARAGKTRVTPALRADLAARQADRRTLAALSLLELGDWAGAARALGDDSPLVRRAVACHMLAEPATARRASSAPPSLDRRSPSDGVVPLLLSGAAG